MQNLLNLYAKNFKELFERREWDSNPQAGFPTNDFQDRPTTNYHISPRTCCERVDSNHRPSAYETA